MGRSHREDEDEESKFQVNIHLNEIFKDLEQAGEEFREEEAVAEAAHLAEV